MYMTFQLEQTQRNQMTIDKRYGSKRTIPDPAQAAAVASVNPFSQEAVRGNNAQGATSSSSSGRFGHYEATAAASQVKPLTRTGFANASLLRGLGAELARRVPEPPKSDPEIRREMEQKKTLTVENYRKTYGGTK